MSEPYNELFHTLSMPKHVQSCSQSTCTSTIFGFLSPSALSLQHVGSPLTIRSYTKHLKQSMTTFPLTDWIGSTTTPTARGFNCSKLCCVLISSAFLGQIQRLPSFEISSQSHLRDYKTKTCHYDSSAVVLSWILKLSDDTFEALWRQLSL